MAILVAVILLLVWFQRSRTKSGHLANGRSYPINSSAGPNTADADSPGLDTASLPSSYNEAYDTIPTAGNIAYNSHMTCNVAYRTTVGHSVPQQTTANNSGSYVIDHLEYEETEVTQDMMYDYIPVSQ